MGSAATVAMLSPLSLTWNIESKMDALIGPITSTSVCNRKHISSRENHEKRSLDTAT